LTEADVKYLLPEGTSDKMLHFLAQAFRSLNERLRAERRQDYAYAYHDLRDEVNKQKFGSENQKDGGGNVSSIDGLLWRMDSRFDKLDTIFHATEHIELKDMFAPGRCTILQLSDIEQHEQQVIVGTLLRRVNKARVLTGPPGSAAEHGKSSAVSGFYLARRSASFRARRSERRLDQYPETNSLRRQKIRRRHRANHPTSGQTRPGRSLAMYDANHYANRQPD
jgi:hypothetical protein